MLLFLFFGRFDLFSFMTCIHSCFFLLFQLLVARLKEAFNNAKLNRDDNLRNTLILTTGEIGRYRRDRPVYININDSYYVLCNILYNKSILVHFL